MGKEKYKKIVINNNEEIEVPEWTDIIMEDLDGSLHCFAGANEISVYEPLYFNQGVERKRKYKRQVPFFALK
jgi:hypothetical protein